MSSIKDHHSYQHSKRDRPPKPKPANPIEEAVKIWLSRLPTELQENVKLNVSHLMSLTPKRWIVYPPMVLLPSGSLGEEWWATLGSEISSETMGELWRTILDNITKREGKGVLTHLAINSGIPLNKCTGHSSEGSLEAALQLSKSHNILRTPSGLIMLYGDFGPSLPPEDTPTSIDLEEAFWVSTKQNGITQVWAPRYTMFSRGNVKEKARLLEFHDSRSEGRARDITKEELAAASAVDLYAGIGYFVFSYVKMGMKQVIGWELNPWSVEGLKRGAAANGWSFKVVKDWDASNSFEEKIVVFSEDNVQAAARLREMDPSTAGTIMHVNCGLLPTSEMTWEMAIHILKGDGWLHLHENVGVDDFQARKCQIVEMFEMWLTKAHDNRIVRLGHVEMVKTFAPGVWHCVFDINLNSAED
ncbi:tRNA wybutosine-synthesizing protein-like protein [Rhexocercosporidium sp. MPI-PUGE-AT-0058]|nr:tRNA wybutosine-synthesizing protein-like protein [Rhexocercosporidium sp. MPI-PUGE-AT-0058]